MARIVSVELRARTPVTRATFVLNLPVHELLGCPMTGPHGMEGVKDAQKLGADSP